jgi:YD repeat-containing protein
MKKYLFFGLLGILFLNPTKGQSQAPADQKMLVSPSGGLNSSLGNLLSPSLFDGTANISIPIHSFSTSYGDFGISLSYNTKGVTVDELSGPVGTHWNLNAGGYITRNVKDVPDELYMPYTGNSSTYDYYTILGRQNQYALSSQASNQYWDGQNDEFIVSAGSLQFSFMMGKNGYTLNSSQNRCKITTVSYNSSGITGMITGYQHFIIDDEQGTKYFFSEAEQTVGNFYTGDPSSGGGQYNYTSKWKMDSVIFANGQKITYDYDEIGYPDQLELYKTLSKKDALGAPLATSTYNSPLFDGWSQVEADGYYAILTAIHYPDNTTATFVFDQTPANGVGCSKSIKQIEIGQGGSSCLKYRFNKAYLQQDPANPNFAQEMPFDKACDFNQPAQRMVLKGIDMLSCDESTTEPYYSFEYANTAPPSRWGNNRDFFGYCNSIPSSGSLNAYFNEIPTYNSPFGGVQGQPANSNKDNTTNASILSALCLTKMKNAYGGSLSFLYETNSGLVSVTDPILGMTGTGIAGMPNPNTDNLFLGKDANDGLRLRATVSEDPYHPGNNVITAYTYSGGERFLNGGYFSYPTAVDANGNITAYMSTNNWVSPHQLINGSNHGYSQVTVTTTDNNNFQLSQTVHYFTNLYDDNQEGLGYGLRTVLNGSSKNYFQLPYTDKQYIRDWEIGLPTKTEEYDQHGNIISRTTNVFESHANFTAAQVALGFNTNILRVAPSPTQPVNVLTLPVIATDVFLPYAGISLLTSTTTEKFVSNIVSVNDVVTYKYDDRNNLITTVTRNSKGEYFRMQNVYNYNVTGTSTLTNMTNDGLEKIVSVERWKGTAVPSSSDLLLDASITGYNYQNGKIWTQKLNTLQSLLPISYNTYTNSGASPYINIVNAYSYPTQPPVNFQEVSEVTQFNTKGNPIETRLLNQNLYKAMIWDTLTGDKIVEANNARAQDIGFTSFEPGQSYYTFVLFDFVTNGGFSYRAGATNFPSDPISGTAVLRLSPVAPYNYVTSPTMQAGKEYIISLWSKNGAPVLSNGSQTAVFTNMYTLNDWVYYQTKITPTVTGTWSFTTSTLLYLDEIRLFPSNATMQSSVYTTPFGPSSTTDATGRITYYEYDAMGRQTIVRDQDGNILSKKILHIGQ